MSKDCRQIESIRLHGLFLGSEIYMRACCCLFVSENVKSYSQKSGERFQVSYDLPADSCFIYFRPDGNDHYREHNIVSRGMIDRDWYRQPCSGLELVPPCGLVNEDLQTSCAGTFTFKDGDFNAALQADLTVECE